MFNLKKDFDKDSSFKVYLWLTIPSLFSATTLIVIILFFLKDFPNKLPLFYSLPWGDKQLASHLQFLIIPSLIIFTTLINLVISHHLHLSQTFFKKILMIVSLITALILIVSFIKIVFIFI